MLINAIYVMCGAAIDAFSAYDDDRAITRAYRR